MRTVELTEPELPSLADLVAFWLRAGDAVLLTGDLGAGKTTFARAVLRASLADEAAEIPSPTFPIVQAYDTPRGPIAHFDFYRLKDDSETAELGIDECLARGAIIVEWPERAMAALPPDRLEITFAAGATDDARSLTFTATGAWRPRLERLLAARDLLDSAGWSGARLSHLQGDASARRYARLTFEGFSALLMDSPRQPDGPPVRDGQPYSRIAHLAEDVRPFIAVDAMLASAGLSAPQILGQDMEHGLLLLEDFGDRVFGRELAAQGSQPDLWRAAVSVLQEIALLPEPEPVELGAGPPYTVPPFDRPAMTIESELLLDWYVPAVTGAPATAAARDGFAAAWAPVFGRLLELPRTLALRDVHSPNLLLLPDRAGPASVGLIDFQDALWAPHGYDLVSLLQDARLDVPESLESELLEEFVEWCDYNVRGFDPAAFRFAYRALGAQRATKILGIFARLARRDGKPAYLAHLPRVWGYLERNLQDPALAGLRAWYDRELPPALRVLRQSA